MQIMPTPDQLHALREWGEPLALPFIYWVWRQGIKTLKESLNEIITGNVNRIRDELQARADNQLKEHSEDDTRQFADLRRALKLPPG